MKKFFGKKLNNTFVFEGDELLHFNVLRCCVGETILCYEGEYDYICEVQSVTKKQAVANIVEQKLNTKNPKKNITVFQGLVKGEKLDLIIQKLTELGVSQLYTFESDFTVAKTNNNKLDRLERVTKEACKQCGRSLPLVLNQTIKFNKMLELLPSYDLIIFANETNPIRDLSDICKYNNIAIVVGSEGGFSKEEIEKINSLGAKNFGLGDRILRAETACIALASIIGFWVGV